MRGAWIEIASDLLDKFMGLSLPVRGAWIEIIVAQWFDTIQDWSLPVRGAWIEIIWVY